MKNHSDKVVMIIDDDKLFRRFLINKLQKELGSKFIEANNPKEAFEYLKKIIPDLIILDMEMPLMDGYTALTLMRKIQNTRDIPVIACTALINRELLKGLINLKISDFIEKRTTANVMTSKIINILDKI